METQANKFSNPLMWIVGIAVIVFCGAGTAAIMGWIPTSIGRTDESAIAPAAALVQPEDIKPLPMKPRVSEEPHRAAVEPHRAAVEPRHAPVYTASTPAQARCAECGVIESTREIDTKGQGSGLGAVGGAVVGGLLGSQIGGGHGNQVATVLGAVGGAVGGNEVEKRVKSTKSYEITVRMDDGASRVFHQASVPAWGTGAHVKIVDGAIRAL